MANIYEMHGLLAEQHASLNANYDALLELLVSFKDGRRDLEYLLVDLTDRTWAYVAPDPIGRRSAVEAALEESGNGERE